jgi:hypothetical protein
MKPEKPEYSPVKGKTYSLFGNSGSTLEYYETIRSLADEIHGIIPEVKEVIEIITGFSSKKRMLKKILKYQGTDNKISIILNMIDPLLKKYTENTYDHLKSIPLRKRWDRRLVTSREQYHLYMLEIELTNRVYSAEFKKADRRIALLPYCLKDFSVSCRSERKGFDYQCNHCSSGCFQNHASEILKTFNIEPYIWMDGDMKGLAKNLTEESRTLGILGIACIPELTWGMRTCRKHNIPVVGVPLNANRCIRWFGEFFPNNIDLAQLEMLLT